MTEEISVMISFNIRKIVTIITFMQWCDFEERLLDGQIRGVDSCFSETLEQSRDYHIAYMYQVGYVSVLGLYERDSTQNNSMKIDEVFHSPEEMADSLLRNWRWQWFYKNRKLLGCQDFENICNLDNKIPDLLQKEYRQSIQILQNKIHIALQVEN